MKKIFLAALLLFQYLQSTVKRYLQEKSLV